ncbi:MULTISPECIES: helix-turn-helix domain-containing protein [Streptomyces]|uniref:helix-turn-helix domain-containing protein n=1 Tax=Streptomyces TaxID=1883 RepID=UPI000AFD3EB4|nr:MULTISPECIES: helix-turn-helix domain-containing protein [Streptomyces]
MVWEPAHSASASLRSSHEGTDCLPKTGAPATFGQLLRAHRRRQGLSLTQLAARVHFNRGHLSRIENDRRSPSVSFAEACDRALSTGNNFTAIASALEAAARHQQGWLQPAQLPAAKHNFVGRRDHFAHLDGLLQCHEQSLAVPVAVVNGPPGVGKTALAVQWAHRAVSDGHFADGQLFVDLQGPEPGTAAAPSHILADLIRAVGVPADRIPADLDQRAATFRSCLHGREVLLVLDNAADAQQIHPLLPGSRGCAVVVTSRSRLPGLMSLVDTVTLPVTELRRPEAAALIRAVIGDARADADPAAVAALAEHCGHLPLALALAAERIVSRQHPSADLLATELRSECARLDLAEGGVRLRTAFDTSYRTLDEQSARVFRLLGRLPGRLIDAGITAAIAGVGEDEAARLLRGLAGVHLIRRHDDRHYHLPELLRAYAADLARQFDGESEHTEATHQAADPVAVLNPPAPPSLVASIA